MTLVSRDVFAHTELHKRIEYTNGECAWCVHIHTAKRGRKYLYRFSVEHDDGRKQKDNRLFCSKTCRDSYYECLY